MTCIPGHCDLSTFKKQSKTSKDLKVNIRPKKVFISVSLFQCQDVQAQALVQSCRPGHIEMKANWDSPK